MKLVIIRATDVPTYVQWGAADLGVAGKDVLMEHGGEGLYEPLDLRIARCRMMVAGKPDAALERRSGRGAAHRHQVCRRGAAPGRVRRRARRPGLPATIMRQRAMPRSSGW